MKVSDIFEGQDLNTKELRSKAENLRKEINASLDKGGIASTWKLESGKVSVSKTGVVKLSFSTREDMDVARKAKAHIAKFLESKGLSGRISITNMLGTYRPEARVTVSMSAEQLLGKSNTNESLTEAAHNKRIDAMVNKLKQSDEHKGVSDEELRKIAARRVRDQIANAKAGQYKDEDELG